jgi:glycosyltransferase involved in cell wall biosynthesis
MSDGVIVHEWLEPTGGAEKVVARLAGLFPDAPIVALWNDAPTIFPRERVQESWLSRTPLRHSKPLAVPFMPATWRLLPRQAASWYLCSSHLFAHHARFIGSREAIKLVYAYTPARYIWDPDADDRGSSMLARLGGRVLRPLDRRRAQEATAVAAISNFVAHRIQRSWARDATVIYPPVAVSSFANHHGVISPSDHQVIASLPSSFILGASRFVPYKRLDQVISTGVVLGVPVVLAGSGPDEGRLRQIAHDSGASVTFVGPPSHNLLVELYARSLAYVFPGLEDFGIMPVEAMATGTPVVGLAAGGVSETVVHGTSGALVSSFDSRDDLLSAFDTLTGLEEADVKARAWEFDESIFDRRMSKWVREHIEGAQAVQASRA